MESGGTSKTQFLRTILDTFPMVIVLNNHGRIQSDYSQFNTIGCEASQFADLGIREFANRYLLQNTQYEELEKWETFFDFQKMNPFKFNLMVEFFPKHVFLNVGGSVHQLTLKYSVTSAADQIEFVTILFERAQKSSIADPDYERFNLLKKIQPELLAQCKSEISTFFDEIYDEIHNKLKPNLQTTLHSLKGLFRALDIQDLARQVHDLEEVVEKNLDWNEINTRVDRLQKDWSYFENLISIFTLSEEQLGKMGRQSEQENLLASYKGLKESLKEWWALTESKEFLSFENQLNNFLLEPVKSIESTVRQDVRSIAAKYGKGARLIFKIDPTLRFKQSDLKRIRSIIMHLMTNAIAHGIEGPDARIEKGQNPEGTIKLTIARTTSFVTIVVEDDGIGFQAEVLKDALVKRGLGDLAMQNMDKPEELMKILIENKVSTAKETTHVAGRGVGLSAVKTLSTELHAEFVIKTSFLGGARFQIIIPLKEKGASSVSA